MSTYPDPLSDTDLDHLDMTGSEGLKPPGHRGDLDLDEALLGI
jgi:hypothetical protein